MAKYKCVQYFDMSGGFQIHKKCWFGWSYVWSTTSNTEEGAWILLEEKLNNKNKDISFREYKE